MSKLVFALIIVIVVVCALFFNSATPFLAAALENNTIEESKITNMYESKISEFICNNSDLVIYYQDEIRTKRGIKTIYIKGNITNDGDNTIYLQNISVNFYNNAGSIIDLSKVDTQYIISIKPKETVSLNLKRIIYPATLDSDAFSKVKSYRLIVSNKV